MMYNIDKENKMFIVGNNYLNKYFPGRDWIEDKELENGNYQCLCINCNRFFIGHKKRLLCFECYNLQSI
jgi:hypothetical protein